MAREKLSDDAVRGSKISVRVNVAEREEIKKKALMFGVGSTEYLRNLGLNYPLTSKVDTLAFLELQKCRGDLGRLGGLLKMWLSDKDRKAGLDQTDVKALLKKIEATQEKVGEYAKKLVEAGVV